MNKIVSLSNIETSRPSSSQVPLSNAELRTLLSRLKYGEELPQALISRFLDTDLPLKLHSMSLEKTTDQGILLVAFTHLLRGSLIDERLRFKNYSNPLNSYPNPSNIHRKNAERMLDTENLNKFKAALKLKLEAFHTKGMDRIGVFVQAAVILVDLGNPFRYLSLLFGIQSTDELGDTRRGGSLHNDVYRAKDIGREVARAIDHFSLEGKKFLENYFVQRRVLKYILRKTGAVEVPSEVIRLMKTTVVPMLEARRQADVLRVNKYGVNTLEVLLQDHPQCIRFFTDHTAQLLIAEAICNGRCGTNTAVLKEVAGQLALFKDPSASVKTAIEFVRSQIASEQSTNQTPSAGGEKKGGVSQVGVVGCSMASPVQPDLESVSSHRSQVSSSEGSVAVDINIGDSHDSESASSGAQI